MIGFRRTTFAFWFGAEQDSYAFPSENMIVSCKNPDWS